jgi:glycosyltransferase involved in cell wall biosynthesis
MRVGLEMRYVSEGACGGITPLLAETLSRLFDLAPRDEFYFFGTMFNQDLFSNQFPNLRKYSLPLAAYWERLESLLATTKIDVLFRGFPVDDELSFPLYKQVTLVPDLQHDLYPEFFNAEILAARRKDFRRLICGSGAVGTISEYTRSVITARYHNQFDDIFLMPPASQFHVGSASENVRPGFIEKIKSLQPYFFYPANMWPHKNHALLLRAFKQFRTSDPTHGKFSLVLSGHSRGWEELAAQQDAAAVTHLGFVSRDELSLAYRNAEALVFMSLCEGFGMPVLEAFGFECPVLCSNKTSLTEIAGDAALLLEPNDADAVARAMAAIVMDDKLRASLVEKGKARFKEYSWERPGIALHKALTRVHERKLQTAITFGHVQGYWDHRFHEQPGWLSKLMGVLPQLERALVGYHALRLGKPNLPPGKAAREVFRQAIGRRVPRMIRPPKPAPTLTPPKPAPMLAPPSWRCVRGFWLDGWLAPVAHFASAAVRSGQLLRLRGSPVVDCRLKIENGTECAITEMLVGGVETTIEFTAGSDDGVTLTFDAFHVDEARREIAFFITHTNLFSEDEL